VFAFYDNFFFSNTAWTVLKSVKSAFTLIVSQTFIVVYKNTFKLGYGWAFVDLASAKILSLSLSDFILKALFTMHNVK
jgi:hypothetical protein